MVDRDTGRELYIDLCLCLRRGELTEDQFRYASRQLGISDKIIDEDIVVFRHVYKNTKTLGS